MPVRFAVAMTALSIGALVFPAAVASAAPDQGSCVALRDGDKDFVRVNMHANMALLKIPKTSDPAARLELLSQIAKDYRTMADGLRSTAEKIADADLKQAVLATKDSLFRYAQSVDDFVAAEGDVSDSSVNDAEADIDVTKQTYREALDSCGLPSA